MSFKKCVLPLPSYLSQCPHNTTSSPISSTSWLWQPSTPRRRNYATHVEGTRRRIRQDGAEIDEHFWPEPTRNRTHPTPYEILQIHPKGPYVRSARFFQLVKLYHPDRHEHIHPTCPTRHLSKSTRTERYRLVVSAHALLSDPEKRRAYDRYGAGWAGSPQTLFPPPDFNMSQEARDACRHNATWQDWEKWYDRFYPRKPGDPPRAPQRPIFLSNLNFISLVGLLGLLAGIGQATKARDDSKDFASKVNAVSLRVGAEMDQVRRDKAGLNKPERIDAFLRERDPVRYADEKVRMLTLNPEICDATGSREVDPDDQGLRRKFISQR